MPAFMLILVAIVAGLVVGTTLVVGAPYLALPIAVAGVAIIGWANFRRRVRRARDIHEPAGEAEAVEFTDRDRATLTPSARPRTRAHAGPERGTEREHDGRGQDGGTEREEKGRINPPPANVFGEGFRSEPRPRERERR